MKKIVLLLGLLIFMVVFNTLTVINASEKEESLNFYSGTDNTYACYWWADNLLNGNIWFRDCFGCCMNTGDNLVGPSTCRYLPV